MVGVLNWNPCWGWLVSTMPYLLILSAITCPKGEMGANVVISRSRSWYQSFKSLVEIVKVSV